MIVSNPHDSFLAEVTGFNKINGINSPYKRAFILMGKADTCDNNRMVCGFLDNHIFTFKLDPTN